MLVKCISDDLRHVHFTRDKDGSIRRRLIRAGDTFEIGSIPSHWSGLVVPVKDKTEAKVEAKVAVTNPAKGHKK